MTSTVTSSSSLPPVPRANHCCPGPCPKGRCQALSPPGFSGSFLNGVKPKTLISTSPRASLRPRGGLGVPVSRSLGLWVDGTLRRRNEKSREGLLSRKRHVHVKPGIKAPGVGEDGAALPRCFRDCVLHSLSVLFDSVFNNSIPFHPLG